MVYCICGTQVGGSFHPAGGQMCGACGARVYGLGGSEVFAGALIRETGVGEERVVYLLGGLGAIGIGRRTRNQIVLQGVGVSREHCVVSRVGDRWEVKDLGSANGIQINGQPTGKHLLTEGDVLKIDDHALTFQLVVRDRAGGSGRSDEGLKDAISEPVGQGSPGLGGGDSVPIGDSGVFEIDDGPRVVEPSVSRGVDQEIASTDEDDGLFELDDAPEYVLDEGGVAGIRIGGGGVSVEGAQEKGPAPVCPGCQKQLSPGTKICIDCGLNVETGRSIVVSRGVDENRIYHNTEQIVRVVSWFDPIGVYPIASEAPGRSKPWTIRVVAFLTILITVWFWWLSGEQMWWGKNLMLWAGGQAPSAELIEEYYGIADWTDWGNRESYEAAKDSLSTASRVGSDPGADAGEAKSFEELVELHAQADGQDAYDAMIVAAHESLTPRERAIGEYAWYQLFTHAVLHADIFHLIGNLYFLMIFGTRVNALIGNIGAALVYPLVGVGAAVAHMWSLSDHPPGPMLGASGAVMGMAGMYLMLFPVNRVHVAAWMRWGLIRGWHLSMNIWPVKGVWVVLFYIVFDAVYVIVGLDDGVAHWAHLGGFVVGMVVVLVMQLLRVVNTGGSDLVSVVLGRRAWWVLGQPGDRDRAGLQLPGWLRVN